MMNDFMNGMFGKIAPEMCRLSMQGGIAIKTSDGYKSYDRRTGRMINCDHFVFPIGEEFFFVIPTNRVKPGDIILASGRPKYVLGADRERITALNYENSVIETILPERQMFLGNTYFYGKIVSLFGTDGLRGGKGTGKILKFMMLSQLLKGSGSGDTGRGAPAGQPGIKEILPMMLLMGGKDNDFSFDLDLDDDDPDEADKTADAPADV